MSGAEHVDSFYLVFSNPLSDITFIAAEPHALGGFNGKENFFPIEKETRAVDFEVAESEAFNAGGANRVSVTKIQGAVI